MPAFAFKTILTWALVLIQVRVIRAFIALPSRVFIPTAFSLVSLSVLLNNIIILRFIILR